MYVFAKKKKNYNSFRTSPWCDMGTYTRIAITLAFGTACL